MSKASEANVESEFIRHVVEVMDEYYLRFPNALFVMVLDPKISSKCALEISQRSEIIRDVYLHFFKQVDLIDNVSIAVVEQIPQMVLLCSQTPEEWNDESIRRLKTTLRGIEENTNIWSIKERSTTFRLVFSQCPSTPVQFIKHFFPDT